jgi:hypothetical protein
MSRSSSPADAPSEAIRHVCPENASTACRASNRSSLTDIRGMRIKHRTIASVMAVAMDTLTVPRRTPKYAFARTTIESRIQMRLEKSSKIIFYAIGQQFLERKRRNESIVGTSCSLSWLRRQVGGLWGIMKLRRGRLSSEKADYILPLKGAAHLLAAASGVAFPSEPNVHELPAGATDFDTALFNNITIEDKMVVQFRLGHITRSIMLTVFPPLPVKPTPNPVESDATFGNRTAPSLPVSGKLALRVNF